MVYHATVCVVSYEANKESEERCFVILLFKEGIFYFLFFSYFDLYIRKIEKIMEIEKGFAELHCDISINALLYMVYLCC